LAKQLTVHPAAAAEGGVELVAARAGKNCGGVGGAYPAGREDFDPAAGAGDEVGDELRAAQGGRPLATGHYPLDAKVDELVQRTKWVADAVERTMEHGRRGLLVRADADGLNLPEDLATAGNVDVGVRREDAEGDAVGAVLEQQVHVAAQDAEVVHVTAEVPGARAGHCD
jgi:hypothetical protein